MAGFKNKPPRKGFNRPTASAGVVVDREWRDVTPDFLVPGDIVAGLGVVTASMGQPDCSNQVWVMAGLPESKEYFLDNDVEVKAFVRKDS